MKFSVLFLEYICLRGKLLLLAISFLLFFNSFVFSQCTSITVQPANTTACAEANATINVNASGTSITYQWQVSTDGGTTYTNLTDVPPYTGSAMNQLNITPTHLIMNGYKYRCLLNGTCSYSNPATLTVNPQSIQVANTNIIGYYPFNGNPNDESGTCNAGALQNTPTLTTDRYSVNSKAYSFNGLNQYITTTNTYNNPTNFTISIWFNTTTNSGGKLIGFGNNQFVASTQTDRHLYMDNQGKIYFGVNPSSPGITTINTSSSYNDGNWHCVSASLSSTNGMKLYMDGSLVASNASVTSAANYTGYWKIGYDYIGNSWPSYPTSEYFSGSLDDVFIFNRELTSTEVGTFYNNVLGVGCNSPVCPGGTLTLTSPGLAAPAYSWLGPNGFSSSSQSPSISNMSSVNEGTYTLNLTSNSCTLPYYAVAKLNTSLSPNLTLIQTTNLQSYYKLNGNANDAQSANNGTLIGSPTTTTDRYGNANSAYSFNGSSQYITTGVAYNNPQNFTISAWFKTSSAQGGKIIGFGSSTTGISIQYDRHVYMSNAGQLYFGVFTGSFTTINSSASYNDNNWHMVTASISSTNGMRLYVDGSLVANDPTTTAAENYTGYWRIGFDNCDPWPSTPTSNYFNGSIDDVLIYTTELSQSSINTLYTSTNGAGSNSPVCIGTTLNLTCATVAGATYSWTGPNGFTSSSQNPSIGSFAAVNAGTYTVQVTSSGCKSTASTIVSQNSISSQPSNASICTSGSTSFNVTTTNSSGFQWQLSTDGGSTYSDLSNTTPYTGVYTSTLNISNGYALMHNYSYRCTLSGSCGNSNAATLSVNPAMVQIARNNIELFYPFNGNFIDESGRGHSGSTTSNPTLTIDRYGNPISAYQFDGLTQYITTSTSYTNPTDFTISCWFQVSSVTPGGKLIGFGNSQTGASTKDDRNIYMSNSGIIYFGVYPSGVAKTINTPLSYNDNKWHMVTASLSSTNGMKLYIDGTLVSSDATMTSAENYTGYWRIGYDFIGSAWPAYPSSYHFKGNLDDIFIYSKELSAADVSSLYGSSLAADMTLYAAAFGAGNDGPVCTGGTLNLNSTFISGLSYSWSGPNGFSSSSQYTSVSNMSNSTEGTYTLSVNDGTCTSTLYTNASINTALNPNISKVPTGGLQISYPISASTIQGNNIIDKQYFNHGSMINTLTTTTDRFGISNEAIVFNGSSNYITTTVPYGNPTDLTIALWFKTSTAGGKLVGFGDAQVGNSNNFDRQIYMNNTGQIYFGIHPPGFFNTINTTSSYNDNNWHQVIASLSSTNGVKLYIDGVLAASNATMTAAQNFVGYWRIGFDSLNNAWPSIPTNRYYTGAMDNILIYNRELTSTEISDLYTYGDGAGCNSPVCPGATLNLLGGYTGAGPTFSWTGPNSYSSTSNNPSISPYTNANAGVYTYKATQGTCTSTAYTIVKSSTSPSAPTASDSSRCGTGTVTLAASGSSLGYNWYDASTGGTLVSSSSSWTTPSLSSTTTYYVSATSSNGCESYPRTAVNAIINSIPSVPATSAPPPVCSGNSGTVSASGSPSGYKWYDASTGGTLLSTLANYTTPALTSNTTYYVTATSAAGCESSPRAAVTVTVNPVPSVTSSLTGNVCSGTAENYTITSSVAGTTYSWSRASVSGISNGSVSGQSANPIGEVLTNTTTTPVNVTYQITPTANGCTGSTANYVVTVNPIPTVTSSASGTVCSGVAQNYLITSGVSGTTYTWSRNSVAGVSNGTVAGQTSNPITEILNNTTPGVASVTYQITPTANGCSGSLFNYIVSVNPTPSVSSSSTGTICSGVAQNYSITSAVSGTTYSWDRSSVAGISNTAVSGQTSNPITEILTNTTASSVNVTYQITPTASSCAGSPFTYTVTVKPAPAITSSATGNICSGVAQNYSITSNISGTTYSWTRNAVTGVSNGTVTGQTANPITETLNNTSGSSVNVTYQITPTANGCTGSSFNYTVTVNLNPSITSSASGSICSGTAENYSITSSVTGSTYSWTRNSVAGISNSTVTGQTANPIAETLTNTTTSPVNVVYQITPAAFGCTGSAFNYTVTVNPTPNITSSLTGTVCSGVAQNYLITSGVSGTTYTWSRNSVAGVSNGTVAGQTSNPVTEALTNTTASPVNVTYQLTPTANGCSGSTANYVVTVNPSPSAPTVTSPVNYCQNATASQLTATGSGLLWYTASSGGTGNATAPTPSTATVGTTSSFVSQTVSGCESSRAQIDVKINAIPAAPTVTSPVTYCQNATASQLIATGSGLLWYTASSGGIGNATAPTPSTTTVGTTSSYVSQTVSGCESSRAQINVVINATPAAPTVTSPVNYCQNTTASQLTATGSGLLWYTVSSGGTGNATAPTPSTTTVGTTSNFVSQTVSGCEGPRAQIDVVINATPAAPTVTSPVNYCQNATASQLTATGSGLLWYTVSSGGTGNATAPTPSTTTVGTTSNYVSQTVSGCESSRAQIDIVINATPAAPTVTSPVNYCQNATASQLTATGSSLLWYTASSGGSGNATAPTPSTITIGTTSNYVSQTVSGCESSRAQIDVTINAIPAAPTVTSPVTYCQNAVAVQLTATGSNLLWYTVPSGGTGDVTAPTPSTTTIGTTSNFVSQTVSGCESSRAQIDVTINAIPAAPTVTSPVSYCQNSTSVPLDAIGSNLIWYDAPFGGSQSTTAPTPSTATVDTVSYYVTQTVSGCKSSQAKIDVITYAIPSQPTGSSPISYCENSSATPLTATGSNLLWYNLSSGGTGSASSPIPSTASTGTTSYYVSQTVNGCESSRTQIDVVINATPAAPTVTSPVNYCQNASASQLTATGSGLLWYTASSGGISNATAPTPSTTTVGTTSNFVSQTLSGCEGPRAQIDVTINAIPAAPIVSSPVNYCQNATATQLTATGSGLLWYTVSSGGTGNATAPTPSTTTVGTTSSFVSQTVSGCESSRAQIDVIINTIPSAPTVTSPVNYCQNASSAQLTATGSNLLWYTASSGGAGNSTAPTPSTTTAGTTSNYVSQTVSGCQSSRAQIDVTIISAPAAPTATTNITYCQNDACSQLTATGSNLLWYSVPTGGTSSSTAPTPLSTVPGKTYYYVTETDGNGCESSRTSILVSIDPKTQVGTLSITNLDDNGGTITLSSTTGSVVQWEATNDTTGYTVLSGQTGNSIKFTNGSNEYYRVLVKSGSCAAKYSQVLRIDGFEIFSSVTPNGDGTNDSWIIKGIENFPDNKVSIFNRLGDLVYEEENYDNTNKVWEGKSNKGIFSGNNLPDGTYFYIIKLENKTKSGYVVIKR